MIFKNIENCNLSQTIPCICRGIPTESEIRPFIRICVHLAMGYLKYKSSIGYRITQSKVDTESELEDIAVDAIADLFERNDQGEFVQISRFFQPYLDEKRSEAEWMILLRRLITSRTDQALFRIFRERDPETAKLFRGIKIAVSNSQDLAIHENVQGSIIAICDRNTNPSSEIRIIDAFEWETSFQEIISGFKPADTIPVLLDKIFSQVQQKPGRPNAFCLNEIVNLIKTFRKDRVNAERISLGHSVRPIDSDLIGEEIRTQMKRILKSLFEKIDTDYLKKDKLDKVTTDGLKAALESMAEDLLNGNRPESNLTYIQSALPCIDAETYKRTLRTKFEYFVKILKTDIQGQILSKSEIGRYATMINKKPNKV